MSLRLVSCISAKGTDLTNTVTETVLSSYSIPANSMFANKVYRARGSVRASATNATDTLTVRVRFGPTTLTGTAVASSGAVDAANADVVTFDVDLTPRASGSSVEVVAKGSCSAVGAAGTATQRSAHSIVGSISTLVANLVEVTGQWSVANAGNVCAAETFEIYEVA